MSKVKRSNYGIEVGDIVSYPPDKHLFVYRVTELSFMDRNRVYAEHIDTGKTSSLVAEWCKVKPLNK